MKPNKDKDNTEVPEVPDFVIRMLGEHRSLKEKINAINESIKDSKFISKVGLVQYNLILMQLGAMTNYFAILTKRLELLIKKYDKNDKN